MTTLIEICAIFFVFWLIGAAIDARIDRVEKFVGMPADTPVTWDEFWEGD